jgi:hypothetical protein
LRWPGKITGRVSHCWVLSYPPSSIWLLLLAGILLVLFGQPTWAAKEKDKDAAEYGAGLIINVPFPQDQVLQIVQEVAQNGIIRGTKEYNKDEYVSGAGEVPSTKVFSEWTEGGKVFYKVRLKALNPQNFKDTNDVGTLAVRYIVQGQDDSHTVLRIDARFVENYRRISHPSNGSVEGAEYKTIHDRLEGMETIKAQTAQSEQEKQEYLAKKQATSLKDESAGSDTSAIQPGPTKADTSTPPTAATPTTTTSPQTLEERVKNLRRQAQRLVKAPGAPLKAAPFHTASTLQSLPEGTEVLVEITTPYWLGVETHAGQHGWMMRDELEVLP